MKNVRLLIVMVLLSSGGFIRPQAAAAQDPISTDPTIEKTRKTEAYVAPYLIGTFPVDKNLSIGGNGFANETFRGTNIKGSGGEGESRRASIRAQWERCWGWKTNFSATVERSRLQGERFQAQMQIN